MLRFAILAALSGCMLVGSAGSVGAQGPFEAKGKGEFRPNAVLVAFRAGTSNARRSRVVADLGLAVDTRVKSPHFARLLLPPRARQSADGYVEALKRVPEVRVAELDYVYRPAQALPNDPKFSQQWALRNTGQTGGTAGADINALNAWAVTTGSEGTIVAVIDTGVDAGHPDLSANILRDGSNQVIGYDFYSNDANPADEDGHGTHVAGTIGAVANNNVGIAGVAHRVRIMPVRFLGPDGGTSANAILSIDFARTNGAHIMNNSWGGGSHSQLMKEAIERARDAGILFVAAAGNAGRNVDNSPFYPASYNREVSNVVSVGATNDRDQRASFSNYGLTVDLFAPGDDILSTVPVAYDGDGTPDGYEMYSGTSMASPHVAGAASLIKSRFPSLGAAQLKRRLLFGSQTRAALVGLAQFGRLESLMILDNDTVVPHAPTRLSVA
ncbi:MAG: S8 family serine peptidase, partial [Fimbriimonadaceae bacterium]|nr:S8 family serine peptidase [Fimbriimonadaceae bacterium]